MFAHLQIVSLAVVFNIDDVLSETVDNAAIHSAQSRGTNGESAEDMLQMALRMAEMHNEHTLDLEDSVDPSPLRARGELGRCLPRLSAHFEIQKHIYIINY